MNKISAKNETDFSGIKVQEHRLLRQGTGVCLPPLGIFVYKGASIAVKQHEYGHYLQYRAMGFWKFYLLVGIPSLWSATLFPKRHRYRSFERDANNRSRAFFGENTVLSDLISWPG